MKVLVVDDEQLVRWFLERALKKWGHDVTSVSNAREALSHITSGNYDILFTDPGCRRRAGPSCWARWTSP